MTIPATRSASEFSEPSTLSERNFGLEQVTAVARTLPSRAQVVQLVTETDRPAAVPADHVAIEDLVQEWSRHPERKAAMEDARRWVADSFYGEEGETVRTLRLRKGLSQAALATAIGTSQPHIARIESGTGNVTIDTCRRLMRALEIDMNTLDSALQRQEMLSQIRAAT